MSKSNELVFIERMLVQAWQRHWWLLGILTLSTTLAGGIFFLLPRYFKAATIISVEREKVINPLTVTGRNTVDNNEERLKTLNQEIHSRTHIEKVMARLKLEAPGTDPGTHERNFQDITNNTTVDIYRYGSFQISFVGKDPQQVRDITNALAGVFIEDNLAFKEGEAETTYSFLNQQLAVYRKKLEDSEIALRQFEEKHLEVLPEAKTANQARLDMLKASLDDVRQTMNQERTQKDLLIKRLPQGQGTQAGASGDKTMVPNPLINTLQEKEEELRRLRQEYSDKYPDVVRVQEEIVAIRQKITQNPTVQAGSIPLNESEAMRQTLWGQIQKLDLDIEARRNREAQLEREINRFQERVQTIPQVEQELARLRRDYTVNSDIYDMFLRRVEEARVSRELESSKNREVFRILEPAVLPLQPYKYRRIVVVLTGVAAGAGLCLLLLYVIVNRDTSFQSIEDAKKYLDLPVLGGIPWAPEKVDPWKRKVGLALYSFAFLGYLAATAVFVFWERFARYFQGGQA